MKQPYNIVCVSNEAYIQHTAVMLCSLFESNKNNIFCIYLLTPDISPISKQRLDNLCKYYNSEFVTYICSTNEIIHFPIGQWKIVMYLKLLMPQLLPTNIERCLFLDVDIIINADITELYHIDLVDNIIAAAEDIPDCIYIKKRLGLPQNELYINSGVMVCNLRAWRKLEIQLPIFNFIHSIIDKIQNEQDVIALYFRDKIKKLPIRWNMVTFYFNRVPNIFPQYLPELKEAKIQPAIIHFAAPIKPWFCDSQHPYAYLYKKYLRIYAKQLNIKVNLHFPYGEQLNPRKRFNKNIRNLLNRIGIIKDAGYTPPIK